MPVVEVRHGDVFGSARPETYLEGLVFDERSRELAMKLLEEEQSTDQFIELRPRLEFAIVRQSFLDDETDECFKRRLERVSGLKRRTRLLLRESLPFFRGMNVPQYRRTIYCWCLGTAWDTADIVLSCWWYKGQAQISLDDESFPRQDDEYLVVTER